MNRYKYILPATVWLLLIVLLSLVSASRLQVSSLHTVTGIDLIAHFILYGVLCYLILWGMDQADWRWNYHYWTVAIFSIFVGILMECLQYWMGNGRNFDLFDIIANIVGTIIGSIIFLSRSNF